MAKKLSLRDKIKQSKGLKKATQDQAEQTEGSKPYLKDFPNKMSGYSPGKGDHFVNVIPFEITENNPRYGEEDVDFLPVFEFFTHVRIGAGEEAFVCVAQTFGKKCPICEERNALKKNGADYETEQKPLFSKRREMYNVAVLDSQEELDKGTQILEISHHFFGKKLAPIIKKPILPGRKVINPYIDYSMPDKEDGKMIVFTGEKKTFQGIDFTEPIGFRLQERDEDVDDSFLEKAIDPVTLLAMPYNDKGEYDFPAYYKQAWEALWGEDFNSDGNEETSKPIVKAKVKTPVTSKPAVKAKVKVKEPEPEEEETTEEPACPFDDDNDDVLNFGINFDEYQQCDDCTIRNDCEAANAPEEEPEPEPEIIEGEREVIEEKETKEFADDECPAGHVFGVDFEEKDECGDECGDAWDGCLARKEELQKEEAEEKPAPEPKKAPVAKKVVKKKKK